MAVSNYQNQPDYSTATVGSTGMTPQHRMNPTDDLVEYLKCYAREKPEQAALWCLGIGFCLGWKLKPW